MTPDQDLFEYCLQIRRHLHQLPELSFEERNTQAYIGEQLILLGLEGHKVAGTGLYTKITVGRPGPRIAFRADIDALPLAEKTGAAYASKVPGVMHACGHDGHVAVLLGLARTLAAKPEEIKGEVLLIFQPAEEKPPGGAAQVVESGVLQNFDAVFGLHLWDGLPQGKVGISPGPMLAAADTFTLEIQGQGTHGAMPHKGVDPIIIGAQIVNAWQTIPSRRINPLEPVVVTVGTFQAGTNFNIIPDTAVLTGTVRSLSEEARTALEWSLKEMAEKISAASGGSAKWLYERGYPVLSNNPEMTGVVLKAASAALGEGSVAGIPPVMGGEDFSYYGLHVPAAFFFLGIQNVEKGYIYPNHSPHFDFDEEVLFRGVQVFTAILDQLSAMDPAG